MPTYPCPYIVCSFFPPDELSLCFLFDSEESCCPRSFKLKSWKVLYLLLENFPLSSSLIRTHPEFRLESWSCYKHLPVLSSLSVSQSYINFSLTVQWRKELALIFLIGSSFHFLLYICIWLYCGVTMYYDGYPKFVPHLYTYPPNLWFFFTQTILRTILIVQSTVSPSLIMILPIPSWLKHLFTRCRSTKLKGIKKQ